MHISGFTERFDYFVTREHIPYERAVAISKFALYTALATVILMIFA
jgi:hypothetical protein